VAACPRCAGRLGAGGGKSVRRAQPARCELTSSFPHRSSFTRRCFDCACPVELSPLRVAFPVGFLQDVVPVCNSFNISLTFKETYFCLQKCHRWKIMRSDDKHRCNARIRKTANYFCKLLGRSLKRSTNLQACSCSLYFADVLAIALGVCSRLIVCNGFPPSLKA